MEKFYPIVMDNTFRRLALIDDYISFIWTSRFYSAGDFELCVTATSRNRSLLQKNYFVSRDDDDNIGIVEKIIIEKREDGSEVMIVSGRFLIALLGRRIIAKQTTVTGTVSDCIDQLITENAISPTLPSRRIPILKLGTYSISQTMKAQYTGQNLLETLSEICETYKVGMKCTLDRTDMNAVFELYEGVDRTYDQTENPWVIFSDKYDNLLSSKYEENYQTIVTAVLVAGEGEGLDRKTLWVTDDSYPLPASGIDRYEAYKDQRNLQSNDGEISDEEYEELMEECGLESLSKYTTAFTGSVNFYNIKYKEDVNLGDLCVIQNSELGIYVNSRLVEVIESVSESGVYSIIPTFGM